MDIFTTQLTRVVPVPIKSENLKVKALSKDAAINKLKEDPSGLEEHDYYLNLSKKVTKDNEGNLPERKQGEAEETSDDDVSAVEVNKSSQKDLNAEENKGQDNSEPPHLDIYI